MRATFAAGCFWGVQKTFDQVPGVISTTVGYCGGHTESPTYEQVCHGDTGHAESIDIIFDPQKVSYQQLLEIFWHMYHPATGEDKKFQYRSAIFYHDAEQQQLAVESQAEFAKQNPYAGHVNVQIANASPFYAAEDYHQKYYLKHGANSC
ncbi:MAG TPA: peptide-methionine (S)-S-oxide reductase MsrA [Gammaproteobacteria bacterium]|nr:peptide-methionine (S)-S-oxide reductase MsrA [Gammaproteobacteria bacterium]